MNIFPLFPLASALIAFFLGAFILGSREKTAMHSAFVCLAAASFCWPLADHFAWGPVQDETALRLLQLSTPAWITLPFFTLNITYLMVGKPRDFIYYTIGVLVVIASVLGVFTDQVTAGVLRKHWGVQGVAGRFYLPVLLACDALPGIYAIALAIKSLHLSEGLKKQQLKYFVMGFLCVFLVAMGVNVPLLLYPGAMDYPSLGSTSLVVLPVFIFIAVIKYRLMSVQIDHAAFALFAQSNDGILLTDGLDRVVAMNSKAEKLLFLRESAVKGSPLASVFPKALSISENETRELRFAHETVAMVSMTHLQQAGVPIGKLFLFHEITELRHMTDALLLSEKRFKDITYSIGDWVWEADVALKYTFSSGRVLDLLGLSEKELLGRSMLDFIVPEDRSHFQERMRQSHPQRISELVSRHRKMDGQNIWFSTTAMPLFSKEGELIGFKGVHADITERKQLEQTRAALNQQIQELQDRKMVALGQLAGGVAHDFNNMLAVVFSCIEVVRLRLPETTLKELDSIENACRQSAGLVRQMLAFARRSSLEVSSINLHESIERTIGMLKHSLSRQVKIIETLEATHCYIEADPGQIEAALLNLSINARDAMPQGGELHFATTDEETGICLKIHDTGTGMDESTLKHCFEPFYTTKDQGHGTGLGLASVHGTVSQHGGAICVESKPGQGTTFTLRFPVVAPPPEVPKEERTQWKGNRKTLLFVDDEAVLRQAFADRLASEGYRVLCASDGVEALKIYSSAIDLVIMDLAMPVMGGKACAKALRDQGHGVPIIILSGFISDSEREELASLGVNTCLDKPITFDSLVRAVEEKLISTVKSS